MRIAVINGTTRQGRFSEKVATWVTEHFRARQDVEVELIDLRDHPLPFFDQTPPAFAPREYGSDELARLGRALDAADGFVVLVAEYNHGYSAVLKNALDHTFVEWRRKPVAFVGWGGVGGARAVEQLRQVVVEFEAAPLRHAVHVLPDVFGPARQAADPVAEGLFEPLEPRLKVLGDDLILWARALAAGRAAGD